MGVFSIIQKHKLHHSNIYSGAPMPFMQRITWSGVAMHAGVLPGYPASHGCIRMPMAFAAKMWNWTKMGARVMVTPGEMTPASFSHPLLAAQKIVPQPVTADETKSDLRTSAGGESRQGRGCRSDDRTREFRSEPRTAVDRRPRRANPHRGCQQHSAGRAMPPCRMRLPDRIPARPLKPKPRSRKPNPSRKLQSGRKSDEVLPPTTSRRRPKLPSAKTTEPLPPTRCQEGADAKP